MARLEADLKLDARNIAEAMGWIVYDGTGPNGTADKIFLRDGFGWVGEFKREDGSGVISIAQETERTRCQKRGVPHYYIDSLEQLRKVLLSYEKQT